MRKGPRGASDLRRFPRHRAPLAFLLLFIAALCALQLPALADESRAPVGSTAAVRPANAVLR